MLEEMPYRSLSVEGIKYFYTRTDRVIPQDMLRSGLNWAGGDIENFVKAADRTFYQDSPTNVEAFHLESYEQDFLKKLLRNMWLPGCEKILEIGCGDGKLVRALAHFCPKVSAIGIDPYLNEWWKTGAAAEENWQVRCGDGQNIKYPADTFDLIVSVCVFEHILSPEDCLKEIKRVLKPGGLFITAFSPIWSGIIGHHCEHWVADTVNMIPPWGHLYLSIDDKLHLRRNIK